MLIMSILTFQACIYNTTIMIMNHDRRECVDIIILLCDKCMRMEVKDEITHSIMEISCLQHMQAMTFIE